MAGTTSPLAFPFPTGTDRVADGDNAIQALAEKLDDYLAPLGAQMVMIPPASGWTSASRVYRIGPICVFYLDAGSNAAWGGSSFLGTVPVGFRPHNNLFIPSIVSATGIIQTVYVNPSGGIVAVQAQPAGSGGLLGQAAYFCTG